VRNAFAIARQQVGGAFGHPLAYVVLALFLGWLALTTLWVDDVVAAGVASMRRPLYWMAAGLTLLAPALTMRLLAEDRRAGILQVVGTWPLTPWEIVIGKWLAALAMVAVALLLSLSIPIGLSTLGPLDPGPVLAGYLALLLLGAATVAIGTAASAWTRHQVLAFLVAFALILAPWILGAALPLLPAGWAWLEILTVDHHLDRLVRGVVDTRSVVLLATVTLAALRTAVLALEHERLT